VIASHVPKLLLGLLLILTLSLKIPRGVSQAVPEQSEMVRTHIATFLARQGFKPDRAIAEQKPDRDHRPFGRLSLAYRRGGASVLVPVHGAAMKAEQSIFVPR
jgi:hypothetical protein